MTSLPLEPNDRLINTYNEITKSTHLVIRSIDGSNFYRRLRLCKEFELEMSMTSQYFLTDYLTYRFNIETYCLRSETVKFCKNERNLVRVIYKWLRKSFILFRFIFIVVGSYERGEEYN